MRVQVVQVLPAVLEGRMALANRVALNRGKARCIAPKVRPLRLCSGDCLVTNTYMPRFAGATLLR